MVHRKTINFQLTGVLFSLTAFAFMSLYLPRSTGKLKEGTALLAACMTVLFLAENRKKN